MKESNYEDEDEDYSEDMIDGSVPVRAEIGEGITSEEDEKSYPYAGSDKEPKKQ